MKDNGRREAYIQKLRDPRWQKMRLKIFERDRWTCQSCEDNKSTLHVHHLWYEAGHDPWDYPDDALLTLCESCHGDETERRADIESLIVRDMRRLFSVADLEDLAAHTHGVDVKSSVDRHDLWLAFRLALTHTKEAAALMEKYHDLAFAALNDSLHGAHMAGHDEI